MLNKMLFYNNHIVKREKVGQYQEQVGVQIIPATLGNNLAISSEVKDIYIQ